MDLKIDLIHYLVITRGFGGWIVTRFEPTNVNMVTYLVAFAIANYTHLSDVTDSGFEGETQVCFNICR